MERKPYKSGGDFSRDGNGAELLFTKRQVMSRFKKMCKNNGWHGMKEFKVVDRGEYFTAHAC